MIGEISKSEFEVLRPYFKGANLTFNKSTSKYWGYFIDNVLVGFCGVMLLKNKAVLKNAFVLPEYRGRGIYRMLNEHRFNYLRNLGYTTIEGTMTEYSLPLHIKNGAKVIKQYKKYTKVIWVEQL